MSRTVAGDTDLYTTYKFYTYLQKANINMAPGYLIGIYGFNEGPKISNDKFKGDYNIKYLGRDYRCSFHNFGNDDVIGFYLLISDAIPTNIWDQLVKWFNIDIKYRRCIIHNLFMAEDSSIWSYNFATRSVDINRTTHQGISGNNCYFLRDDLRKLIDFAEFSGLTRNDLDHDDYSDRLVTDQIKYLCEKISIDCDTYEIPVYREEVQELIDNTRNTVSSNPETPDLYKIMRYKRCYGDWFGFVFKPNWNKENDWFDKQIPDKYPTITKLNLADDWEQQIDTIINSDKNVNYKAYECLKVGNIDEIRSDINAIIANVDNYLREELRTMIENIVNLVKVGNKMHFYFNNNFSALFPVFRTFLNSYMYLLDVCQQIAECSIDGNYNARFEDDYKCYVNRNEPEQTDARIELWDWINNIVNTPDQITASYMDIKRYREFGYTYITNVATEEPILYNDSSNNTSEITSENKADLYLNSDMQTQSTFSIGDSHSDYRNSMFFRWLLYNEKQIIGDTIISSSSIISMIFGNSFRGLSDGLIPQYDQVHDTPENTIWFLKDDIDVILGFVEGKTDQEFEYAGQSKLVDIFRVPSGSPLQLTYTIESLTRFAYPIYNIWRFESKYRTLAFNSVFIVRDTSETSVPEFKVTSDYSIITNESNKFEVILGLTTDEYKKPNPIQLFRHMLEEDEYATTTPGDSSNILRVKTGTGEIINYYKTLVIKIPNAPYIPFLRFDFEDISYKYKLPLPYTLQNDECVWINTREEYEQWINQYNSIQVRYMELLLKMVDYCMKHLTNDGTVINIYGLECYPKEDVKSFVKYSKQLFENEITLCNDYFSNYFMKTDESTGKNKLQEFYNGLNWDTMDNIKKSIAYRHITLGRVEVNTDGQISYSASMIDDIINNLDLLYSEIDSKECYYITSNPIEMVNGDITVSTDRYNYWSCFKGNGNTMEKYLQQIEPAIFIQDIRYYALKPDRFKYIYTLNETHFNQSNQLVMSKYDYEGTDITSDDYINTDLLNSLGIGSFTKYSITEN